MANAWGELSWNSGLWGEQSNAIAAPTGIALTVIEGEEDSFNTTGWGRTQWGNLAWGAAFENQTVSVTGQQLNLNTGNVGISGEINAGWGRLTWGENAWGIQGDVLITGIGLDVGIGTGSVTIDVVPEITGEQQNLSIGDPSIITATEIFLENNPLPNLTVAEGTVDPGPDVMLTGIGLTSTTGTLEGYNEEGWGRTYWGEEVWGASGFWAFANTTGIQINASVGTVDAKPLTIASPTGIELTAAEGTVDPSPDATVIGIGLTAGVALGSVVEADANVTTTGNQVNIAQGTAELDAVTFAEVTGQQLNTSLNSAVAGASAEVSPTGVQANINLGNISIQAWQIVDTGTTVSYTEVSTGTSVTWNEIDTAA
jgi:hypothetical protein